MKLFIILFVVFAVSGCHQKPVEERINDAVIAIQENRLDDYRDKMREGPRIVYKKSVTLFNVKLHCFEVYYRIDVRPLIPRIVIAVEDSNKVVRIAKNKEEIIRYMKPFNVTYDFDETYLDNLYTRKNNKILLQVMELYSLLNIDSLGYERTEIMINTLDDIPNH